VTDGGILHPGNDSGKNPNGDNTQSMATTKKQDGLAVGCPKSSFEHRSKASKNHTFILFLKSLKRAAIHCEHEITSSYQTGNSTATASNTIRLAVTWIVENVGLPLQIYGAFSRQSGRPTTKEKEKS
jgi:hypothetical protein